jgi:hypothetical protein
VLERNELNPIKSLITMTYGTKGRDDAIELLVEKNY